MLFRKNEEGDQRIWLDRGIDSRVDDLTICEPCDSALRAEDPKNQRWHDTEELCGECRGHLPWQIILTDLLNAPRPFNGMLEDRLIANDEFEVEPPQASPAYMPYFDIAPYELPPQE